MEDFDPSVAKKYEIMRAKNEFLLQNFPNFPLSETVIQNYRCTYKQGENSYSGKVWLTQNYLLFTESSNNGFKKQIPLMDIKNTASKIGFLYYTSEIQFDLESGFTATLTNFYHFNEAFILISYLIDHSPCYYHLPQKEAPKKTTSYIQESNNPELEGRWGTMSSSFKEIPLDKYEKADIGLAEECLSIANETYETGLNTRAMLEEDARALDHVER